MFKPNINRSITCSKQSLDTVASFYTGLSPGGGEEISFPNPPAVYCLVRAMLGTFMTCGIEEVNTEDLLLYFTPPIC